jgi:hypothetical protein
LPWILVLIDKVKDTEKIRRIAALALEFLPTDLSRLYLFPLVSDKVDFRSSCRLLVSILNLESNARICEARDRVGYIPTSTIRAIGCELGVLQRRLQDGIEPE